MDGILCLHFCEVCLGILEFYKYLQQAKLSPESQFPFLGPADGEEGQPANPGSPSSDQQH